MHRIDYMLLRRLVPHYRGDKGARQEAHLTALSMCLDPILTAWGIDTILRKAHSLGQTSVESWDFADFEEEADGSDYEGRQDLGNIRKGDGERYKGRGLIQVTGRYNYGAVRNRLPIYESAQRSSVDDGTDRERLCVIPNIDLVAHPEALGQLPTAVTASCAFWKRYNVNRYADADDGTGASYVVNTIADKLAVRLARTKLAKRLLEEPDPYELGRDINSALRKVN